MEVICAVVKLCGRFKQGSPETPMRSTGEWRLPLKPSSSSGRPRPIPHWLAAPLSSRPAACPPHPRTTAPLSLLSWLTMDPPPTGHHLSFIEPVTSAPPRLHSTLASLDVFVSRGLRMNQSCHIFFFLTEE
jgi:hypothetical protein